ncbi:MAG: hypothetical protein ACI9KE_001391 [Polyangiales bacterium]|jgi:hypothetical protein
MLSSGSRSTECVPSFHALLKRIRTRPSGCSSRRSRESGGRAMYRHKRSIRWRSRPSADFGEGPSSRLLHEAKWADELVGLTARRRAEQLNVGSRRAVARREDWLVSREGVGGIADAFETSAMALERSRLAWVHAATRATSSVLGSTSSRADASTPPPDDDDEPSPGARASRYPRRAIARAQEAALND